jgi:hypothetical protein
MKSGAVVELSTAAPFGSTLNTREGNTLDKLFLGQEEQNDDRNCEHGGSGHELLPFYVMRLHEGV